MKSHKISSQLIKGYIIMLSLILVLAFAANYIYQSYTQSMLDKSSIDMYQIIDDYYSTGKENFNKQPFEESDFLIITDTNHQIIDAYQIEVNSDDNFDELQTEFFSSSDLAYYIFESDDKKHLFHLYLGPYVEEFNLMLVLFPAAILIFACFTFIYAKRSSQNIVLPIKKLNSAAKEIAKGNYNFVIQYETGTELDLIRDEFNEMSSKLLEETHKRKQLEHERNQLIMSLSHDIKTPLTNVIGYSQTLLNNELEADVKASVETIHKYGLLAAELTDELFDYTKVNMNEFVTEVLDITELTRVKLIEYINEFETLNIDYEFDIPSEDIKCRLNMIMYHRVLDNLIQNAIKYNRSDFSLNVSIQKNEHIVVVTVEDNGIGIPAEYHDSIFEPMVRVDNSRNRTLGGTGLGLSIVKEIIKKHQGHIYLDDAYMKGCRFIIKLPHES